MSSKHRDAMHLTNAEQGFTARWITLKEAETTGETNGDQATIRYQQNPFLIRKGFVF